MKLGAKQRANFLTCTRMDGHLGQGKRGNTSVVGGGITGLVKCLNLEWSPVFCRAIDIQAELSADQITEQILAEYHDADLSTIEVAYSEEGRKTTVAIPSKVTENKDISTTVTNDSVFLVSGGARGVTATCVMEMAKAFQCKFILLGRSNIEFEVPDFAKNESDAGALKRLIMNDMKAKGEKPSLPRVKSIFKNIVARKEMDDTISTIRNHGGEVMYIQETLLS